MIKEKVLYSLGDITIIPSAVSKIRHRAECNVFYKNDFRQNSKNNQGEYLPIFVSPMASVINEQNIHIWNDNNLIPIVPRTVELNKRIDYAYSDVWAAFGLDEFVIFYIAESHKELFNIHPFFACHLNLVQAKNRTICTGYVNISFGIAANDSCLNI